MSRHPHQTRPASAVLGVDTGGTFTDFCYYDGTALRVHKVLSTPQAPEQAILTGLEQLNLPLAGLRLVHGSTVATNAVLEGKGARTAFITNRGLGDMLTIGRQARPELYDLQPGAVRAPVPKRLCLETGGRLGADGNTVDPLNAADLAKLTAAVRKLKPQAVAVCLLFSFFDDRFEQAVAKCLPSDTFVSLSSQVLPEYREYERAMATWLNAYVGPLIEGYLLALEQAIAPARLAIMQSSGVTCAAEKAAKRAVHLLLSGPAGGLQGARFAGALAGNSRLMTLDMGGTSTDVALIDGRLSLTSEGQVAGYPVGVPMVDMHTIGAGGGSIAYRDAGGMLRVGPQSAGAAPGPACYGAGGIAATVTDANVVLGRLPADTLLGGYLALDRDAAWRAVARLGRALELPAAEVAAGGIVQIANEHMAQALRVISVQRGLDPRDFALMCFGGAGGLHVCELAEQLGMDHAVVPVEAGVLSAMGMLVGPPGRQMVRTLGVGLDAATAGEIETAFARLRDQGLAELQAEGIAGDAISVEFALDLCYHGQSFPLTVIWHGDPDAAATAFHAAHEQRYGHRLAMPIDLVNIRVGLQAQAPVTELSPGTRNARTDAVTATAVFGIAKPVRVRARESLAVDTMIEGPTVIAEAGATTYLAPGWRAHADRYGNLQLQRLI